MTEPPLLPGTGQTRDRATPPTPRWVKMFGLVALALFILFLVVHLSGGGLGRHMSPAGATDPAGYPR
jgi:hypothetical protein